MKKQSATHATGGKQKGAKPTTGSSSATRAGTAGPPKRKGK